MLRNLRIGKYMPKMAPEPIKLALNTLSSDAISPISLRSINELDVHIQRRLYRTLLPPEILADFDIHPITWKGPDQSNCVEFDTVGGNVVMKAWSPFDREDPFFTLELSDNLFNSINLNWVTLNDPTADRYPIDISTEGSSTLSGTVHRNLEAEREAMEAGLSPAQVRQGLRGFGQVLAQLESFLIGLGHGSVLLEPLTYTSAWIFEKHGFAYMQGHRLMERINMEFQPTGELHRALDGSTPFRQPEQWRTVRGRAWAIHDGILEEIGENWDDLRMTKQVGRCANVKTFPDAIF